MRRVSSTLVVATTALLLVASYPGATAAATGQVAEVANASPAVSKSTATLTSADSGEKLSGAKTPEKLLKLLGERIVARDVNGIIALHEPEAAIVNYDGSIIRGHKQIRAFYVEWFTSNPVLTVNPRQTVVAGGNRGNDGKIHGHTASIMGDYSLRQTRPDGTPESFTGSFCDIVRQQPDGSWLYVNDNPYPPHGGTVAGSANQH